RGCPARAVRRTGQFAALHRRCQRLSFQKARRARASGDAHCAQRNYPAAKTRRRRAQTEGPTARCTATRHAAARTHQTGKRQVGTMSARLSFSPAFWTRAGCNNRDMRISELNGDSSVIDIVLASGQFQCKFEDGDTGVEYSISVPTDVLYAQVSPEPYVHVRLIELKKVLPIDPKSQIYIAPQEFGPQMRAANEGFMLAVGLKSTEWPLFLQIRGTAILAGFPIESEESVCVQP